MIAALLLAAAVLVGGISTQRRRRLRSFATARTTRPRRRLSRVTLTRIFAGVVGLSIALWLGNALGIALGGLGAAIVAVALSRSAPRTARRRQAQLDRQTPLVADLLASCMSSGATIHAAVSAVARSIDPPMSEVMSTVERSLAVGAPDPWSELEPSPLARAMRRSTRSGAPLADVLPSIAEELRRDARVRAEAAARSAGVRAVLPLVACFLPAFLLIGVVPVVASLAQSLWK
jgi:pilus assembly protein TadC